MKFFKSKAFFSLTVLLAIALIAGALLAVMHDLLFVSAEERTARSFEKIYGAPVRTESIELPESERVFETGEVLSVYLVEDGNYLLESKGVGGYKGTVTVWTIFTCTGSKAEGDLAWTGIGKVVYGSDENESFLNKIPEEFYLSFTLHDDEVVSGELFSTERGDDLYNVTANVTHSSTAIVNAVNTAIVCFREHILGGGA